VFCATAPAGFAEKALSESEAGAVGPFDPSGLDVHGLCGHTRRNEREEQHGEEVEDLHAGDPNRLTHATQLSYRWAVSDQPPEKPPQTSQDAADAVLFAARRLVHGMRREGVPQITVQNLHEQLFRAVDMYESMR